jgi:hypothetical protein
MNEADHDHSEANRPQPEVHREREIIVTNSGGQRSGMGTAAIVVFGLIAVVALAFFAFLFLQREDGSIIPDDIDINVEVPKVEDGS